MNEVEIIVALAAGVLIPRAGCLAALFFMVAF